MSQLYVGRLPPIGVARGRVLVDGFHRWQAHKKENAAEIQAIDLGDLLPIEILKESIRRNASHGRQLDTNDKRRMADKLYREGVHDNDELMALLSITADTLEKYLREAKRDEKEANKAKAWDLWLDCLSYRQIGEEMEVDHKTVADWCGEKSDEYENSPPHATPGNPWGVVQHFDVWSFQTAAATAATSDGCRRRWSRTCCGCTPNPATSSSIRSPAAAPLLTWRRR